ncbi:MAG: hypothetical protein ABIP28_13630 [Mucilaginibacter sp.]
MKVSLLKDFFDQAITNSQLNEIITPEISNYKLLLSKKGSSVPIILQEDIQLLVRKKDIAVLCEAYLNEEITKYELMYIIDALQLSDNISFENEELLDNASILTDPEVNGLLTKDMVYEVLQSCKA